MRTKKQIGKYTLKSLIIFKLNLIHITNYNENVKKLSKELLTVVWPSNSKCSI